MQKTQQGPWAPVGEVLDALSGRGRCIKDFKIRQEWAMRNVKNSTLAFYNDGRHLFIDSQRNPPTTYYDCSWQHVPFKVFSTPKYILASEKIIASVFRDQVLFHHKGHAPKKNGSHVQIMLGSTWDYRLDKNNPIPHRRFFIPPLCIYYVAVRNGQVRDSLLIVQPLPLKLFRIEAPSLRTEQPQFLVLKK